MRISDWSSDVCSSDLAADDLQSNRFVLGEHHFSLAVFADSQRRLADNLSAARAALADAGLVAAREGPALEAAFWAQLPGNFAWRARPAAITSRNFAALAPFHTYPAGRPKGNHWGPAIAMMKRSEEHTSEIQSLMRISYAVFCLKK